MGNAVYFDLLHQFMFSEPDVTSGVHSCAILGYSENAIFVVANSENQTAILLRRT